jgi:hypothetical protein
MNDIITVIGLLSKTKHDYTKRTIKMNLGEEWVQITLDNGIEFNFKKDGTINYISKKIS